MRPKRAMSKGLIRQNKQPPNYEAYAGPDFQRCDHDWHLSGPISFRSENEKEVYYSAWACSKCGDVKELKGKRI